MAIYRVTAILTEEQAESGELTIMVNTRKQAQVINDSLKASGNSVRVGLSKEVKFEPEKKK